MSGTIVGSTVAERYAPTPGIRRWRRRASPSAAPRRSGTAIAAKTSELTSAVRKTSSSTSSRKLSRPTNSGARTRSYSVSARTIVTDIAYGLLWLWLLNPIYGPINTLLGWGGAANFTWLGYPLPQWLTHPNDARAGIIILSLFAIGEGFVILLVTRQGLPAELYDLAALEDVTAWGLFRRVTLPLMAPILVLLMARDTIFSLQATLVPALVVTDGGPPLYSTTYVPLFVYRNAFEYLRYGYAAAATVFMLLVTAALVGFQLWYLRRLRANRRFG